MGRVFTAVTVMTLLVEVRDRDISNKSQRERNLPQKLKVTVLATSRQVLKFPAWKSAIALRIVKNASEKIWPVVIVAILVIAFLKVRPIDYGLHVQGVRKGVSQLIFHGNSQKIICLRFMLFNNVYPLCYG